VPFGTKPDAEQQAKLRDAREQMRAWRTSASMDRFKALRKMFNDAGVTIYAWKQLDPDMTDAEMDYVFNVAEALGNTHTTLELVDDPAQLKRIGQFGEKHKIYAAYHTHLQGSMTAFDGVCGVEIAAPMSTSALRRGRRRSDPVPEHVPRPHRELPPEGSNDARARREESGMGNGRHTHHADPAAGETEQMDDAGVHRAGVPGARRIGCGEGSREVPGLLPPGTRLINPGARLRPGGLLREPLLPRVVDQVTIAEICWSLRSGCGIGELRV
jgi:hypothetical protein